VPCAKDNPKAERLAVNLAEAASLLGLHRASLRAAIDRGEIWAVRVGRRWLVPESAIRELLASRTEHDATPHEATR
jgi:excisionase family DNA binding protein